MVLFLKKTIRQPPRCKKCKAKTQISTNNNYTEPPIDWFWTWDVGAEKGNKSTGAEKEMEMLFHNQFQVTFYINGRRSWLSVGVQGMSACLANTSVHTQTKREKAGLLFFILKTCPVVCVNLEIFFFCSEQDFDLDLSPSRQWINNEKRLAREVRTQTQVDPGSLLLD